MGVCRGMRCAAGLTTEALRPLLRLAAVPPKKNPPAAASPVWKGHTQAIYYRDKRGGEPVNDFLEQLLVTSPAASAKIDDYVEEHLNGRSPSAPEPEFPITSQIEGELRELRVRFAKTRYRVLYQRSANLVVLLHAFEKNTGAVSTSDKAKAQERFADFQTRMDAKPRVPPRAAGHDAPPKARRRP
jgi:phage-related protein